MTAMLRGFKEFLFRGNVVDLAIAVVMGTAFTALVTSVVTHLVDPLIAAVGGRNVNGLAFQLVDGNPQSVVDIGAIVGALVNFVVVAGVVYVALVAPMRRLLALRRRPDIEEAPPAPAEDVLLLREIRDLLTASAGGELVRAHPAYPQPAPPNASSRPTDAAG